MSDMEREGRLKIGEKIRRQRAAASMSIEELAAQVGVTPSVISQIENDVSLPSIAMLLKISKALKVSLGNFFQDEMFEGRIEVIRKEDRRSSREEDEKAGGLVGYAYEALSNLGPNDHMKPFLVEFDFEPKELPLPQSHEGEEFIFILSGEIEVRAENQVIRMREGDSIYFDSRIPHLIVGRGKTNPRAVAVLYTP